MLKTIIMFVLLFCVFLLIKIRFLKRLPSDTASGAIVMACGIFINGAMKNIRFLEKNAGEVFTVILLLFWIFIISSYIKTLLQGTIKDKHLKKPIKSFAVGTWVAGTSVLGIAIFQRLSWFNVSARLLFFVNMLLWIFYIGIVIRNYGVIFREGLHNKVHGVILLSTVSTQSTVVLGSTVFGKSYPILISRAFIILGVLFYIIAFVLIMKRYFFSRNNWNIEDDWLNTNCIIHGAMSITGLASVVSRAVDYRLILVIWIWILIWFVIVESIELYRAWRRIKKYGFSRGIAVYDVTQWSRIFTFGMFYAFTMRFDLSLGGLSGRFLFVIRGIILRYGTWVMVLILIVEGLLFFKDNRVKNIENNLRSGNI